MRKNKLFYLLFLIPLLLSCEQLREQNIQSVEKKIVVVVGYHAIENRNFGYSITRDKFEKQVNFLSKNGYQSIGLDDLVNYFYRNNDIPTKSFILTFDDGSISDYDYVFPYLISNKLKAIFFIPTKVIGTEGHLTSGQIREMKEADCCDFGSHSVNHKNLLTLEDDKLVEELNRSKETLEKITEEEIFSFAYPNGFFTEREVIFLKKQNYKIAFSVLPGLNDTTGSPFEISRIVISAKTSMDEFKAVVEGDPDYYRHYYSQMYAKSAKNGLKSIERLCKKELSKYAK